jgi:PPM family protein phosphatase
MDTQPAYWTIGPSVGSASSVGKRGYVESAFCVADYSERASKGFLCFMAVADGFGGPGLGDVAARMAVEIVGGTLDPGQYEAEENFRPVAEQLIANSVAAANKRLYDVSGMEGKDGLGTTLTFAALDSENAFVGHIGNARAYVLTARGLRQITSDHVETGQSGGKRLTRALGVAPAVDADILRVPLRPGEVFFICTHGVFSTFSQEEVAGALLSIPDLQAACQWLADAAVARGASGDATITAWRVPGDVPVVVTQAQAQAAGEEAEPQKKHGRRWLVALLAVLLLAGGAAGGWFIGGIWYQNKSTVKKPSSSARFAAGDVTLVDTTGRSEACYLLDYPGGPEQTRLYDGWKVRVVTPRTYKGQQWYRVEVVEGGTASGKKGYVSETFLVESR